MALINRMACSLILLLLGLGFLLYNTKYPLDTLANPGPGIFPLMAGMVLVLLVAIQLIKDLLPNRQTSEKDEHPSVAKPRTKSNNSGETRVMLTIVIFIGYLIILHWIGFFTASVLFVIITSKLLGARDWGRPIILALGVNIFCYYLFVVWLKLSFPSGIFF